MGFVAADLIVGVVIQDGRSKISRWSANAAKANLKRTGG